MRQVQEEGGVGATASRQPATHERSLASRLRPSDECQAQFTPGPWEALITDDGAWVCASSEMPWQAGMGVKLMWVRQRENWGNWICDGYGRDHTACERETVNANAHLAAAAPELYAAADNARAIIGGLLERHQETLIGEAHVQMMALLAALAKARGEK